MIDIQYRVGLFGSYDEVLPNPNNIKYFVESFSDKQLIPIIFQEFAPNGDKVDRLSLANSDRSWLVQFGFNRMDIYHTNMDVGVTNFLTLNNFILGVNNIVKIIQEKFPRKHHRLALLTKVVFDEMDAKKHDEIYRKLNNTISVYNENPIADWNTRTGSRISYEFDGLNEMFNVVSNVRRVKGLTIKSQNTKADRVELDFDINTYQGNTDYRFEKSQIASFLDQSVKVERDLREQYIELINS